MKQQDRANPVRSMDESNTMPDGANTDTTLSKQLKLVMRLLTDIRDENRQNMASLQAQMHIMQERLTRMETKTTAGFTNPVQLNWHNRLDSKTEHEDAEVSGSEGIHRECLQENLHRMTESFDLQKTLLIDRLVEDSCLSENEASVIRENVDTRDQTRNLVVVIGRRSRQKFQSFLKGVREEYPDLYELLNQSYDSKLQEGKRPTKCLVCVIKQDVDIRHVVDKLVSNSVVDLEFLDFFCKHSRNASLTNQANLWDWVFANVDKSQNRNEKIKHLIGAMYDKYEHISAKLGVWQHPRLVCQCQPCTYVCPRVANFADSFSSLTSEISSTSDVDDHQNIFKQSMNNAEQKDDLFSSIEDTYSNIPLTVNYPEEQSNEVSSTEKELGVENSDKAIYNRQNTFPFQTNHPSEESCSPLESPDTTVIEQAVESVVSPNDTAKTNILQPRNLSYSVDRFEGGKRKYIPKRRKPSSVWVATHRRTKSDGASTISFDELPEQQNYKEAIKRHNSVQDILQ